MSSRVKAVLDPSPDVLRYERRALDPIFQPKSVAVVGATESAGSVGRGSICQLVKPSVLRATVRWDSPRLSSTRMRRRVSPSTLVAPALKTELAG